MNETGKTVRVWDPLVRIGHWLLVLGFFTAYFTEDEWLDWHVWAGYVVGAVVLLRIFWGIAGTKHARFTDFVYSPRRVIGYLGGMFRQNAPRYLGHNPAGGAMIVVLLLSLIVTTWSGLMVYAYEEGAGPLKNWVTERGAVSIVPAATADSASRSADFEAAEEYWEELHEFFANFTLFLVLLHIAGVIFASAKHRENLVKAMITGRKRAGPA